MAGASCPSQITNGSIEMITDLIPSNLKQTALLIGLASLAALIAAWFTQYVLGYAPCQLCYAQRWPYYAAIVISAAIWLATDRQADNNARWLVGLAGLTMLAGACIAVFHSGVEWKFWPGPSSCTTGISLSGNIADLMAQVKQARVVPCDEPPFRVFGASPANANVLISIAFAAFCFAAIRMSKKPSPGR